MSPLVKIIIPFMLCLQDFSFVNIPDTCCRYTGFSHPGHQEAVWQDPDSLSEVIIKTKKADQQAGHPENERKHNHKDCGCSPGLQALKVQGNFPELIKVRMLSQNMEKLQNKTT